MADGELGVLRRKAVEQEKALAALERFQRRTLLRLPCDECADFPLPLQAGSPAVDRIVAFGQYLMERKRAQETLEESLRAEMLQCERQRAYIMTLEEAVRARAASVQFPYSLHDFVTLPLVKKDADEKRAAIADLQQEIDRAEIEESGLEAAVEALRPVVAEIEIAAETLAVVTAAVESEQGKSSSLQEEIRTLQTYLEGGETLQVDRVEAECAGLNDECARLETHLQELTRRQERLREHTEGLPVDRHRVQELRTQHDLLTSMLADTTGRVKEESEVVEQLERDAAEDHKTASAIIAESKSLESHHATLHRDTEAMSAQLLALHQQLRAKTTELAQVSNRCSLSEKEVLDLSKRLDSLTTEQANTQKSIDSVQSALESLRSTKARDALSLKLLTDKHSLELSSLRTQREAVIRDLKDMRARVSGLQSDLAIARAASSGVEESLKAEATLRTQVADTQKAIADAKREVVQLAQAKSALRLRLIDANH